jgi:uncharacterized membrane protein
MDLVSLAALVLAVAVTLAVYDRLPDPMATHFDLHGTPNGWMPRPMGAWFMPVLGAGLWAFMRLAPRILPVAERKRVTDSSMALVAAITIAFLAAIHVLLLRVAIVPGASITEGVWLAMGALWIALGLVLPRLRRNAIVGVRTPWTLTSDENWARTQRVAGYAMVGGGIVALVAALVGGPAAGLFALFALLASGVAPAVYSLLLARRQDAG